MKTLYSILLAGLLSNSHAAPPLPTAPKAQAQWTKAEIVGLSIELIDPVTFESMTFKPGGTVPLTVGRRNGPLTAPLFYWEFLSDRLRITSDGKQLWEEFTLISRDATTITLRRHNGKVARYKVRPK